MKKFLFITILFFILFIGQSYSQYNFDSTKVRPEILKIAKKIAKVNEVQSKSIGFTGTRSKQYLRYEKLKNIAHKNELVQLTNHFNPVVRCYAFWALRDRQESNIFPLLLNHIHDTVKVITQTGCIGEYKKTEDFCINLFMEKYLIEEDKYRFNSCQLNYAEKRILDSTVIFMPNNLFYTFKALQEIEPNLNYYIRIRELALEGNIFAVIALAKFNNEKDLEIILNSQSYDVIKSEDYYADRQPALYYTFMAISFFPNEYFWNFLKNILLDKKIQNNFTNISRAYFQAVASFKKRECLDLLISNTFIGDFQIFEAIEKFNSPIYDTLKFSLWENDNIITRKSLDYLLTIDSSRTVRNIIYNLENSRYFLENYELNYSHLDHSEKVLGKMLDTVLYLNKELGVKIISKKITFCTGSELRFFTHKAGEIKDSVVLKELFSRITNNRKDFKTDDYWYIMQAILSYENPLVEQKLFSVIVENKEAMNVKFKNKQEVKERIELIKEWIIWERNHEDFYRVLDEINM